MRANSARRRAQSLGAIERRRSGERRWAAQGAAGAAGCESRCAPRSGGAAARCLCVCWGACREGRGATWGHLCAQQPGSLQAGRLPDHQHWGEMRQRWGPLGSRRACFRASPHKCGPRSCWGVLACAAGRWERPHECWERAAAAGSVPPLRSVCPAVTTCRRLLAARASRPAACACSCMKHVKR